MIPSVFTTKLVADSFAKSIVKKEEKDDTEKLFRAVEQGNKSKVKSLLRAKNSKIEINRLNKDKQTVLDIAVDCSATKIAAELMKHGAKVTSEQNALALREMFKMRGIKFFIGGLFFCPLWFGSFFALDNMSQVKALVL